MSYRVRDATDPMHDHLFDTPNINTDERCHSDEYLLNIKSLTGGGKNKGTLRSCLEFWRAIRAPARVLRYIEHGFAPEFNERGRPEAFDETSGVRLTEDELRFLDTQVEKMLREGCIRQSLTKPHCVSPVFCVPKGEDTFRKIFDLRRFNEHIPPEKFKLETLDSKRDLIRRGDWCVGLDLTSAFWSVAVDHETSELLGFQHRGKYYCYMCLPFGAAFSPVIFDLITRPLRRRWRQQGFRVITYVDDISIFARTREEACAVRDAIIADIEASGFVINYDKSQLEPTQQLKALGWTINTATHTFDALPLRQAKIACLLRDIENGPAEIGAKELAGAAGKISALALALGRLARLLTRSFFRVLKTRTHRRGCRGHDCSSACWRGTVYISEEVRRDCNTLAEVLEGPTISGPIQRPPWTAVAYNGVTKGVIQGTIRSVVDAIALARAGDNLQDSQVTALATDAGDYAAGGWEIPQPGHGHSSVEDKIFHTFFSAEEAERSSTHREMQGIDFTVDAVAEDKVGHTIYLATDNLGAAYILGSSGGSPDPVLAEIARHIFSTCLAHSIDLRVIHVPRGLNTTADAIAGLEDRGEWRVNENTFQRLQTWSGEPFTLDLFASPWSTRLKRFCSRWGGGGSIGNAFEERNLSREHLWVHPPPCLLLRTLNILEEGAAQGVLVVPFSPAHRHSAWWPRLATLAPEGRTEEWAWSTTVLGTRELPRGCMEAPAEGGGLPGGAPTYRCLAVAFDFSQ